MIHKVISACVQVGIELGDTKPQKLNDELAREAQPLVTMGCEGRRRAKRGEPSLLEQRESEERKLWVRAYIEYTALH